MFCELADKLFNMKLYNEEQAKRMLIDYSKKLAPNLSDEDVLHLLYNYTGLYSFEKTVEMAGKVKKLKETGS